MKRDAHFGVRRALRRSSPFALAIVGLLLGASLMGCLLVGARMFYTQTAHYWFLLWNLVLAWVPLGMAGVAHRLSLARRGGWVAIVLAAALWLLFFPNAPYILTDFLHLGGMGDLVPGWYDVIMLFWFAWTGLLLGVVSLYLMHRIVRKVWGSLVGWAFVVAAAGLGGFGIYLGRFLRWNSWDLLRRPLPLADQLLSGVGDALARPRVAAFTLLFALLFLFIYVGVYIFARFAGVQLEGGEAQPPAARPATRPGTRPGARPGPGARSGPGGNARPASGGNVRSGARSGPGGRARPRRTGGGRPRT